ncbi:MAG: hypothetical protein HN521_23640, partial [Candidatus Latescibacteria bacterium]|nr:hypothetical protein [Candidatus Latescibacterota bacterium]
MRRLLGMLVLVLGVSDICAAIRVAQPDPVLEAWRWQVFSERDGLVSIRVRAIASEGNAIWFATDQGVSKYDGLLWETYTVADGLPSDDVLAVQVGADGVVWFGTVAGVCRFDPTKQFGTPIGLPNKAWKAYGEMEGMPGERVSDLVFGLDGRLWAATDGGAAYLDVGANEWMVYTTADGLADDEVNGLAVDADGAIWFATERGASRYDGVSWQSYRRGDGLQGTSVTSVFSDREGNVWFAQYGSGLACLKNGHWFQYTESEGLPDEGVRQVFQTKDGVIWVVCRSGIARLNAENQWQSYHRSKLPGLGEPYTAGVDAQGAVWIGGPSSRGVVRFDYSSRRVSVYELGQTVDMSKGKGIGQDRDGAIWFGTGIGAVRFDGSSWSLAGGFRGVMSAVYGSEDGTLYLAGRDKEGPLVVATLGLAREEIRYGLSGEAVTAVTRTRDGTLWAGVKGGGLFRRNVGAGAWEVQEKRREIPRRILAMSTSADGGLWLAGRGQDLCRRSPGGMWRAFNLKKSGDIQTLLGTRSGSLWLGLGAAGGGAIRLNDVGGVEVYTVKDGLAHDEVHALVEDRQGALWAATSGGV